MKKIFFLLFTMVSCLCYNSRAQLTITPSAPTIPCGGSVTLTASPACADNLMVMPDDKYSGVLPIGFNFQFYNNVYSSFVISSNGYICFNLGNAGLYSPWPISSGIFSNPDINNSIAGIFTDIYIPAGGNISWGMRGSAPNRKLVVTFCNCALFSCTSQLITFQMILYEGSNIAEVHIKNRSVCGGWNAGAGMEGVENASMTAGTAAPGRNYPPGTWTVGTPDAYRFTPNGSYTAYTVSAIPYHPEPTCNIAWYQGSTYIGTGASITVSPLTTTTYTATSSTCDGPSYSTNVTVTVTPVNPNAGTISGPANVCGDDYVTYTSSGDPGGVWSSSNSTLAPINSSTGEVTFGNVSTPTTVTLTYTVTTPCGSASTNYNVTIYPDPNGTPTGPVWVCSGSPFTVSATGITNCSGCTYLWDFGATTIPATHPAVFTAWGISVLTSVTLTNSYGCSTTLDLGVDVMPRPIAGTVECPHDFCAADAVSYICNVTGNNMTGTWSMTGGGSDVSIDPVIGDIIVNPAMSVPHTVTVCYTVSNMCGTDQACCSFTVYPNPQFTITPPFFVCSGVPFTVGVTFTSPYSTLGVGHSYLWNTGATTSSVTDVRTTTLGMSYIYSVDVTNAWGCTSSATTYVNVDPAPYAGVVRCPHSFCAADMVSYTCSVTGNNGPGTWSLTGGGGDVTIDPVYGWLTVNPSTSVVRTVTACYTVTNSCGTDVACCTFTVYPNPQFTVTGPAFGCSGVPFTFGISFTSPYSSVLTGHSYLWSTGATTPTMTDTKYTSLGMSYIYSVTVTNSFGCSTTATPSISINPPATANMESCPQQGICVGQSVTVYGFPGFSGPYTGTWSCTPPSGTVITLSSPTSTSVVVTGVAAGTATLTYTATNTSTGCSGYAICIVTVNPSPAPISGPSIACIGNTTTLTNSVPGGVWTSTNTSVATVANVGGDGIVTGVAAGTATIVYTIRGCSASLVVTVMPSPTPHISKCVKDICEGNVDVILGDPLYASGYTVTWTVSPAGLVALSSPSAAGVTVTGIAFGAATVTYTVTDPVTGCSGYDVCVVNVWPGAGPIAGPTDVCEGQVIGLIAPPPPGGVWVSSNTAVATVGPMGNVTGISGGTAVIDYIPGPAGGSGCYSSTTINVISATACVTWAFDPACGCNGFIFSGTPGANVNFDMFDCDGTFMYSGTVTLDAFGFASIPSISLGGSECRLCITTIDYMGCTWHCNCPSGDCCADRGAPKPGRTAEPASVHTLQVIPNPNKGTFTLAGTMQTKQELQLQVIDILGRSLFTTTVKALDGNIDQTIVMTDNMPDGVYFIKLTNSDVKEVLRFTLKR